MGRTKFRSLLEQLPGLNPSVRDQFGLPKPEQRIGAPNLLVYGTIGFGKLRSTQDN